MDIVFQCPQCNQVIAVDEAGQGLHLDCPRCGQRVIVPAKTGSASQQDTSLPEPTTDETADDSAAKPPSAVYTPPDQIPAEPTKPPESPLAKTERIVKTPSGGTATLKGVSKEKSSAPETKTVYRPIVEELLLAEKQPSTNGNGAVKQPTPQITPSIQRRVASAHVLEAKTEPKVPPVKAVVEKKSARSWMLWVPWVAGALIVLVAVAYIFLRQPADKIDASRFERFFATADIIERELAAGEINKFDEYLRILESEAEKVQLRARTPTEKQLARQCAGIATVYRDSEQLRRIAMQHEPDKEFPLVTQESRDIAKKYVLFRSRRPGSNIEYLETNTALLVIWKEGSRQIQNAKEFRDMNRR